MSLNLKNCILTSIKCRKKENPVLSRELETSYGLSGTQVRDYIRELRRDGEPVVATDSGYYFSKEESDVQLIHDDLQRRIISMSKTDKLFTENFQKKYFTGSLF